MAYSPNAMWKRWKANKLSNYLCALRWGERDIVCAWNEERKNATTKNGVIRWSLRVTMWQCYISVCGIGVFVCEVKTMDKVPLAMKNWTNTTYFILILIEIYQDQVTRSYSPMVFFIRIFFSVFCSYIFASYVRAKFHLTHTILWLTNKNQQNT